MTCSCWAAPCSTTAVWLRCPGLAMLRSGLVQTAHHRACCAASQMNTGEGKTLVAALPAYLNALEGKGVFVVTVNDFLAERDAEE